MPRPEGQLQSLSRDAHSNENKESLESKVLKQKQQCVAVAVMVS